MASLRRGFAAVLVGNCINAAAQWGIVVVLARGFDPTTVGQYALALAISGPTIVFTSLKLRSVVVTDSKGEYSFSEYFQLRWITVIVAFAVIVGIAVLSGLSEAAARVVVLVGLAKSFDAVGEILQAGMQRQERMTEVAVGTGGGGLLALALVVCVVRAGGDLTWVAGALVVASLVLLVGYQWPTARRYVSFADPPATARPGVRLSRLWSLGILAAPLGFNVLLGALAGNIPRYSIEHVLGAHALGIFAAVSYFTAAGTIVINSAGQAVTPRLAELFFRRDHRGFRRLIGSITLGGVGLGAAGIALSAMAGKWLLGVVYGPEYMPYADLLVLLSVAAAVTYGYVFLGTGVTAMRLFHVQVPISIVTSVTTATGCMVLVPRMGLKGAAVAILVSAVLEAFLYLALIRNRLRTA